MWQLQETEAFGRNLYAEQASKIAYLIAIGDKTTQRGDVQSCREFINALKKV